MAYTAAGSTTHYRIFYDDALSAADGNDRAAALLAKCEQDFALMQSWFPGVAIDRDMPMRLEIRTGPGASASWGGTRAKPWPIALIPGNGAALDVSRYLLVAEVTEMFMAAQSKGLPNKGFYAKDGKDEASIGEGLSHFLAMQFLIVNGLSTANVGGIADLWLNGGRPDYVNTTDEYDRSNGPKSACSVLFLWYLNVQLGFDITSIVGGAAHTLTGVYKNLTGDGVNPSPDFKQVLDSAFSATKPDGSPQRWTLQGPNRDNPFPLPSPRVLSAKRFLAGSPPERRTTSMRELVTLWGKGSLRPTLNTRRRDALL